MIRRTSSVRPEPTSPAMPSSSPARTEKLTSSTTPGRVTPSTRSSSSPRSVFSTARSRFSGATSADPVMWAIRLALFRSGVGQERTTFPSLITLTQSVISKISSSRWVT